MNFSKRTLPSLPGGCLNRAFTYVPAVHTNVRLTFERARLRIEFEKMSHDARTVYPAKTITTDRTFSRANFHYLTRA